ncbi:hypothetical protein LTR74_008323 [Friedmanniomyces endolithicus]|nr:hypothetical protein LTR74_008323 [Friedmanniomyces endolithicus]
MAKLHSAFRSYESQDLLAIISRHVLSNNSPRHHSTTLTSGLNTVWLTNNGALSPIFITVDSTTTQVVGGAAPIGASVVVAATSSSTPNQTPSGGASPFSIAETLTAFPTTSTSLPSSTAPVMQTVTTLSTNEDLATPAHFTTAGQNSQTVNATMDQTLSTPFNKPNVTVWANNDYAGASQQRTETLILAIVIPTVVVAVLILVVWWMLRRSSRRSKSLGESGDGMEKREFQSSESSVQELHAAPPRKGVGRWYGSNRVAGWEVTERRFSSTGYGRLVQYTPK